MLTFAAATGAVAVVACQHEVSITLPEVLLLLACVVARRSFVAAEACIEHRIASVSAFPQLSTKTAA